MHCSWEGVQWLRGRVLDEIEGWLVQVSPVAYLNKTLYPLLSSRMGVQWLSGRVLDLRPRGRGFEPHWHHCLVSLSKNINPSLVLVQPKKTHSCITERLLM